MSDLVPRGPLVVVFALFYFVVVFLLLHFVVVFV